MHNISYRQDAKSAKEDREIATKIYKHHKKEHKISFL